MRLDHVMYAVPSLEEGIEWAGDTFGVAPAPGGSHKGLGTRNALLSLGDCYLEIIAPDPDQLLEGTNGEKMAALSAGGLVTWAAEGDLRRVKTTIGQLGIDCAGPVETQRQQPDGATLVWELLFPRSGMFGMPFFIDWKACSNPAVTAPPAGTVTTFEIHLSSADKARLGRVLSAIDLDIEVNEGQVSMRVVVDSPKGQTELASTDQTRALLIN